MARPRKDQDQKRRKWPVLNVTPTEREAIEAAAQAAGLGINAYLIACTRQTRLVRRAGHEQTVRHLARIDAHLEQIAREVVASSLSAREAASLLLALRRVELSVQADVAGVEDDDAGEDAPS